MISKKVALIHISKDRGIFDHFRAFDNVWVFLLFSVFRHDYGVVLLGSLFIIVTDIGGICFIV